MKIGRLNNLPFHIYIATFFTVLFLLLGGTLLFTSYTDIFQHRLEYQRQLFEHQTDSIELALQGERFPANTALLMLRESALISTTSPLQHLAQVPTLAAVLRNVPNVSAVYAGYPNGDFFLLRHITPETLHKLRTPPPVGARYLAQNLSLKNGQHKGEFHFFDERLKILASQPIPDYSFDPRQREWYRQALSKEGFFTSSIYPFFFTGEQGLSFSIATSEPGVVVGADVSVKTLSSVLAQVPNPSRSLLVLSTIDGHILASTAPLPSQQDTTERLPSEQYIKQQITLAQPKLIQGQELHLEREPWYIQIRSLNVHHKAPLLLTLIVPSSLLQEQARASALKSAEVILLFILFLVPAIWWMAQKATQPLHTLSESIAAIGRLEFTPQPKVNSPIREVRLLEQAMATMRKTLSNFISIGQALGAENRFDALQSKLLIETSTALQAEGAVLYLQQGESGHYQPSLSFWHHQLRNSPPPLDRSATEHSLAPTLQAKTVQRTMDAHRWKQDFSSLADFKPGLILVAEPLRSRRGEVIGVLALLLPPLSQEELAPRQSLLRALAGTSAVALDTQRLLEEQKALLAALIELIAGAIDAKSPYTGGHCQRVPVLTQLLAQAAHQQQQGPFANFHLDDEDWEALHIASWLHDCGKVTTPEYVVDKATKLETLYDRIHEVRMRFEVLKRDAQISALEAQLPIAIKQKINAELKLIWKQLDEEFAFVAECNLGTTYMDDAQKNRLQAIADRTWLRTLDDNLGISHEEQRRKPSTPPPLPCIELLLADKPEHEITRPSEQQLTDDNPWGFRMKIPELLYHKGELHNLTVARGTLTDEERFKINDHIIQTIKMLDKLPFPRHLAEVPEIAGGHHEKMDGTGYPRGLKLEQLSVQARIMSIADIFEALTASDRPYKPAKSVDEALKIMGFMAKDHHIDHELFQLFIDKEIWREYAEKFLLPEQLHSGSE
ncbi:phosphodiesterase [Aeromonas sobria]|nr:phosphodiesterase [Aeromonas sobria]